MTRNEYAVCDEGKWTDIGNPSKEEMAEISKEFNLNEHIVRDCMQPEHLPKYELVEDVHFLILRFYCPEADKQIATIQELTNKIAIFYTDKFIITIHKSDASFLEDIRSKFVAPKKCSSVTELLVKNNMACFGNI